MAFIFYEAINKAIRAGKVLEPQAKFEQTSPICDKFSGTGIYPGGKTQRGTGFDDSVYRHDSEEMGVSFQEQAIKLLKLTDNRSFGVQTVNGIAINGDLDVCSPATGTISSPGLRTTMTKTTSPSGKPEYCPT